MSEQQLAKVDKCATRPSTCTECGKAIMVRPRALKFKRRFCDQDCFMKNQQVGSEDRECANPKCKKIFRAHRYRKALGQGQYCSSKCYGTRMLHPPVKHFDVRETLKGDCCKCLICGATTNVKGKPLKSLAQHLRIHELSCDDYREKFGFNRSRGLICEEFRERKRKIAIELDLQKELIKYEPGRESKGGPTKRYEAKLDLSDAHNQPDTRPEYKRLRRRKIKRPDAIKYLRGSG